MLDVDGRPHVDAAVEQALDVLVALRPLRAARVRVGELVHDRDRRAALEQPLDVRLGLGAAPLGSRAVGARSSVARAFLGGRAAVRLDVADDDVDALLDAPGSASPRHW